MATVQCAITKGDLPVTFNWLFKGAELPPDESIVMSKNGQRISVLTIETIRAFHAGFYTCVAINHAGQSNHSSELKVIGTCSFSRCLNLFCFAYSTQNCPVYPILLPFEFGDEPADTLSTTTVSCTVAKGDFPIEINWMFNGAKIDSSESVTITKSGPRMSILYIDSVRPEHAGLYSCVARNKAGFTEHSSELKVIG